MKTVTAPAPHAYLLDLLLGDLGLLLLLVHGLAHSVSLKYPDISTMLTLHVYEVLFDFYNIITI